MSTTSEIVYILKTYKYRSVNFHHTESTVYSGACKSTKFKIWGSWVSCLFRLDALSIYLGVPKWQVNVLIAQALVSWQSRSPAISHRQPERDVGQSARGLAIQQECLSRLCWPRFATAKSCRENVFRSIGKRQSLRHAENSWWCPQPQPNPCKDKTMAVKLLTCQSLVTLSITRELQTRSGRGKSRREWKGKAGLHKCTRCRGGSGREGTWKGVT